MAGNHEYQTEGAAGHYGYFGAGAGDPTKGYFDTRVGAWHVIVLNSNCEEVIGGCGAGSPQEQWLRGCWPPAGLSARWPCGTTPPSAQASSHRAFPTYQPFWQALYDYGAEVVMVGHDHLYERFGFQDPAGNADAVFGLRQFTVGTGGKSHQGFKAALPNSEVRNGQTYGVLKLTLHPDSYDWEFVPEAGKTFTDVGTSACHGAPPAPAPEPGPITRVGSTNGSTTTTPSLTLARPGGTATGQVMVASVVSGDDDATFSAPERVEPSSGRTRSPASSARASTSRSPDRRNQPRTAGRSPSAGRRPAASPPTPESTPASPSTPTPRRPTPRRERR